MALPIRSAVAEELGEQLDVGRLAAALAGARVLEERLEELRALDVELDLGAVDLGQIEEEVVVVALGLAQRHLRRHVEGLVLRVRLVLGRADPDAELAAGAVLRRHLDGVLLAREVLGLVVHRLEGRRGALEGRRVVDLGADGGVRADQRALVALDAELLVPHRDLDGDVALLPLGGGGRPGAVGREGADRQQIALAGDHHRGDPLDEIRAPRRRRSAAA